MPTETRVFESVDSSPEAKAANAEYFKSQGIDHEVEETSVDGKATPPATDKEKPVAAAPTGDGETGETEVDAETAAEWESAQTDVRRKSRMAKKRQEAREYKTKFEEQATKTQQLERELAELKAGKPSATPPAGSTENKPGETPPATDIKPPATGDAAQPKFEEAEPQVPKFEDFAAEDDQYLAYQQALVKHQKEWTRWDRKRERFEETQATVQAQKTQEAKTAREQRLAKLNADIAEVRTKYPDFDAVVQNGNVVSQALSGASTFVPGGVEAVYLLAKDPDKLKQFNEQTAETVEVDGKKVPTQRAWDLAIFLLGQLTGSIATAKPAAPAGSPPAVPTSNNPPREEPAAPRAARGRTSDEPGRDQLTGDQRRDLLAKQSGY